ncbi:hypothetical protein DAPPUDRAFT_256784 [Daphnia pulex]|uniref:BEN domain-containing protein n=1 Tax=Daphnia pulex TaxID=6669 RepID=E9HC28_DAPPU|nr:hypothetical protein DAPPUDRAFT_327903 [Daphnia pulex]EFX70732.1 hypothetical protein DAPPUDRAFT_256784 [Daphnia pulex]|eukprot:EFX70722.1 hypothetical protein DAPPUDRAFT_327903 [Daphnia pulex]
MANKHAIKYVAVFWEVEQKFTVQSVSSVKNKLQLKDAKLVDDVEHQGKEKDRPKEGWKSYPARVLTCGAKKKSTQERGKTKFEELMKSLTKETTPAKKKPPKPPSESLESASSSSGSSCEEDIPQSLFAEVNGERGTGEPHQQFRIQRINQNSDDSVSPTSISESKQDVKDQLAQVTRERDRLKLENEELKRHNLILQRDLPSIVSTLQRSHLMRQALDRPARTTNFSDSSEGASSPPLTRSVTLSSSPDGSKSNADDYKTQMLQHMSSEDLDYCNMMARNNFTKMISLMMGKVFTVEELTTKSLTGKRTTKPALPVDKVNAVAKYILKRHPDKHIGEFNQKVTNYLRDQAAKSKPEELPKTN